MPAALLEPTNIYFVLKGLGRQILSSYAVYLESTLEVPWKVSDRDLTNNQQDARITRRQEFNTIDMTQRMPFFSMKKQGNDWKTTCLEKYCLCHLMQLSLIFYFLSLLLLLGMPP